MTTTVIVAGIGLGLLALGIGWARVERLLARARPGKLEVDPAVRRYLRRRSDEQQQRAAHDAQARAAKREG